jgi:hypothetical protein
MNERENTRLAVVENEILHIKDSTRRIESMLTDHIIREEKKYSDFEFIFAPKVVEAQLAGLDKEVEDLPYKLDQRFAGLWVETWVKATAFTVVGSVIVGLFFFWLSK